MLLRAELDRVKEEIARNASAVESAPFAAVEEINPGTGISDERSSVEPRVNRDQRGGRRLPGEI